MQREIKAAFLAEGGWQPRPRGLWNKDEKYRRLDIVTCDGGAFVARRDDPGACPGSDWAMLSMRGPKGEKGDVGLRGETGPPGSIGPRGRTISGWRIDEKRLCVYPVMDDGKLGSILDLNPLAAEIERRLFAGSNEVFVPPKTAKANRRAGFAARSFAIAYGPPPGAEPEQPVPTALEPASEGRAE